MNKINNLILELNSACNNNCIYCYIPKKDRNTPDSDSLNYFIEQLDLNKNKSIKNIDFTGGEPTLYKDLFRLVGLAKKLGYDNRTLVSNGRKLSYEDYLDKLVDAGINRFVLTLDGPNEDINDKITRVPGSFNQVIIAIKNIKEKNLELGMTIVITKLNYEYVSDIIKKCYELNVDFVNIQFLLPYIEDDNIPCEKYDMNIIPRYDEAIPYVKKAIDNYKDDIKINVHFIPFCLMSGYETFVENESIKSDREIIYFKGFNYNIEEHLKKSSVKIAKCENCKYDSKCIGFFKSYKNELGVDLK